MKQSVFKNRRQEVMNMMAPNSIALLPTAPIATRNRDVEYFYRPDSDFQYLTGFPEPEAIAVLIPGRKQAEYILFCRERDIEKETWHGRRAGQEGAVNQFGADDSFPIDDIDDILTGLLEPCERVYYPMGCNTEFDHRLFEWINQLRAKARTGLHYPTKFESLDHILHELRLFKSSEEISNIRKAADISIQAHQRAMKTVKPGMKEYHLEAELSYAFIKGGARSAAYPCIVGGGANSCILHYIENDATLHKDDMVLIDAGAEYDYYASDITRTFPVSGHFSKAQKILYEIVLEAQYAAIAAIKPGAHWNDPHEAAVNVITKGLLENKIITGNLKKLIEKEKYKPYFMHKTGHWLGMDVHDVGDYKVEEEWRILEPGMVMTVEPGLYIPENSKGVAKKWWNIGIRIEDDVLVTKEGCEVLTQALPKTVAEIEALMSSSDES